jgi:hypothetical protein
MLTKLLTPCSQNVGLSDDAGGENDEISLFGRADPVNRQIDGTGDTKKSEDIHSPPITK